MDPVLTSLFILALAALLSFWAWAVEWLFRGPA